MLVRLEVGVGDSIAGRALRTNLDDLAKIRLHREFGSDRKPQQKGARRLSRIRGAYLRVLLLLGVGDVHDSSQQSTPSFFKRRGRRTRGR